MGLDMNMYAVENDTLTMEKLFEEDYYADLQSWYWRKANQIHNWMVKNVQNEEDDCGVYEVFPDQIRSLNGLVNDALTYKDSSLLPPVAGFFFGSTEVDEWYWSDLSDTKKYLKEMLEVLEKNPQTRFFYCSSWY